MKNRSGGQILNDASPQELLQNSELEVLVFEILLKLLTKEGHQLLRNYWDVIVIVKLN